MEWQEITKVGGNLFYGRTYFENRTVIFFLIIIFRITQSPKSVNILQLKKKKKKLKICDGNWYLFCDGIHQYWKTFILK